MGEQDYFKNALSNFTYDAACGGAIRHKADIGYTVRKIADELDFSIPYEKVQKTVWERYVETSVILMEEPGTGKKNERYQFVKEQNKYGTTSFRRIKVTEDTEQVIDWKTKTCPARVRDELIKQLENKLSGTGKSGAYMSCDFGAIRYRDAGQYHEILQSLSTRQREYIEGLPWELSRCYHKLDERMTGILLRLCRREMYRGTVYFPDLRERVEIV